MAQGVAIGRPAAGTKLRIDVIAGAGLVEVESLGGLERKKADGLLGRGRGGRGGLL